MRLACAHVDPKYPDRSVEQDTLTYGADGVATFGFTGIKIYATPNYVSSYPQQAWSATHTTLVALVQDPAYVTVLTDVRLERYFINTWTFANGINNNWINAWTPADSLAEENELYDLCVHLLSTYSNKEFVIQNWEGDWALLGAFDPYAIANEDRMQRMADYLRARQRAITRARAAVTSTSTVVHAVEVNRCLDKFGGRVHMLLDQVRPDAVSFSLYECINTYGSSQAEFIANIQSRMLEAARTVRRVVGENTRLYVGEYGWNELQFNFPAAGLDLGAAIQAVNDTGDEIGMSDVVFWEFRCNEELSPGSYRGFCVYKPDGSLGIQGTKLATLV